MEALLSDAIGSTQMTLSLIPGAFNAIHAVPLVGEGLGAVDAHGAKAARVQSVAGLERIGVGDAAGLGLLLDDRQERGCRGGGDHGRAGLPAPLERAEGRGPAGLRARLRSGSRRPRLPR